MKIKTIILKVPEKIHKKLWNQKEEKAIFLGRNVSWEEFIISAYNSKIKEVKHDN